MNEKCIASLRLHPFRPSLSFLKASLDSPGGLTVSRCLVSLCPGVEAGVASLGSGKGLAVNPVRVGILSRLRGSVCESRPLASPSGSLRSTPSIQPTETQGCSSLQWPKSLTNTSRGGLFLKTYLIFRAPLWKWPLQGHVARVSVSAPGFCSWPVFYATLETGGPSVGCRHRLEAFRLSPI